MWECSWKLNATSFHCTFQTCVITKLLRTQEIITFSLNFFRTTQCWTERKIYKGMKKYRLKNLIKEQHKRELKIPGNYCQPGLLWTSNYLISPQSHRIINYTAQNNKMSRQITKPHITYSLKKKIFFKLCVCLLRLLHHSLEGLQDHVGLVDEPVGADKHVYHSENNRDRDTRTHVSIIQQRNHGNNIRIDPGNTLIWLEWRMSGIREHKPARIQRKWVKGIIQQGWIW